MFQKEYKRHYVAVKQIQRMYLNFVICEELFSGSLVAKILVDLATLCEDRRNRRKHTFLFLIWTDVYECKVLVSFLTPLI